MVNSKRPYDLEEVQREWIGKVLDRTQGRYPVEHDPIRRHCQMVGDVNPLFLDSEFAAKTRFGAVIAPSIMAPYFAGPGAWPPAAEPAQPYGMAVPTPGKLLLNLNQSHRFLEPIKIGDQLRSERSVTAIIEKPVARDPKSIWVTMVRRVFNQHGDLVATVENTVLTHRTAEEIEADQKK